MYTCIGVCICSDECVWAQQYVRHLEPAVGPDPRYRNCKHQTVELNQLIPHITHMLELRGASLGPHGITALPPPQSIIHMRYQMYGRGLKTATNTNHWILENPASCRHLALRIHVTYMTGGASWSQTQKLLILQKPSAPRVQTARSQTLLKAWKDQQTSWEWWKWGLS